MNKTKILKKLELDKLSLKILNNYYFILFILLIFIIKVSTF